MKNYKKLTILLSKLFLILTLGCSVGLVFARTFTYNFIAVNGNSNSPVKDVTVVIETEDMKSSPKGKKSISECKTDADGKCKTETEVSGGFFAGSDIEMVWRINPPEGYSKIFISSSNSKNATFNLTAKLTTLEDEEDKKREILEAEIAKTNKEAELAAKKLESELALEKLYKDVDDAKEKAFVLCKNKESCDKAFALAEIFFAANSDMKIQISTVNTLETHAPTDGFLVGLKALRIPGKGAGASIRLNVICKSDNCLKKSLSIYKKFSPFIIERL